MLVAALPDPEVEVVEPHPHAEAITLAAAMPNVRYLPELTGHYDLLIVTDEFEHVPDPIGLPVSTSPICALAASILMAISFVPAIACHLP